jgi:RNA polymerase sigma-70 factor (ECF subfamily)
MATDILRILERLSRVERAVYVLHRLFDYPHDEIASALNMTEAAVGEAFERTIHELTSRPLH